MGKIIYSKFSNERSPEFAIQTNIINENADQYQVTKAAAFEEAKMHVRHLPQWRRKLADLYKSTIIEPCDCEFNNDIATFNFIDGKTLEHVLDEYLIKGEFENIFELIKKFFSICRSCANIPFIITDEFKRVFGNVHFSEEMKCSPVNDVDMIFSNIILNNEKWCIIDYEWCFEFPIPVEYILYRAIHYYVYTKEERKVLIDKGIFNLLEKKEKYVPQYVQMEKKFQTYIEGDVASCVSLYKTMGAGTYNIQYLMSVSSPEYTGKNLEIYLDQGNGFSQDCVLIQNAENLGNDEYKLFIPIDAKVTQVRIDPVNCRCIVHLLELNVYYLDDTTNSAYSFMNHNGLEIGEHEYAFNTLDPWFWINLQDREIKCIEMRYKLRTIGEDAAVPMNKVWKKQQQTFEMYAKEVDSNYHHEQELNVMSKKLSDVEEKLECVQQLYNRVSMELDGIKGSTSWKITKPIRDIRKGLLK